MATKELKYKTIEEGGRKYIFAPQAVAYAKERLGTSFGIPSYRTIRYYVTKGVFERPLRRGKETYFDLEDILNEIQLIKGLQPFNPALEDVKEIVPNIKRSGEWKEASQLLRPEVASALMREEGKDKMLHQLATERPSIIIEGIKATGKSQYVKMMFKDVKWLKGSGTIGHVKHYPE